VAKKIVDNTYVDVTMGAESEEEAYETYKEARIVFHKSSINLREWISNSQGFQDRLPSDRSCCEIIWIKLESY